jgi:hypothetical protein
MKINLNHEVQVTLTEAALNLMAKLTMSQDDYFTAAEREGCWQVWRLMQVFGPHMYNVMPFQMFVGNEITLPESQ